MFKKRGCSSTHVFRKIINRVPTDLYLILHYISQEKGMLIEASELIIYFFTNISLQRYIDKGNRTYTWTAVNGTDYR